MEAALPEDETERLAALHSYEILDTPIEPDFDAVTSLATAICGTPISVVNFVAQGRQWFKSEIGLGVRETPLSPSICAHAILQDDMLVVPDTLDDARFSDNPLVLGDPHLRFYAGALLRTPEGHALGTLCVLDTRPRTLTDAQITALRTLSAYVMSMLALRRSNREHQALSDRLAQMLSGRQRLVASVAHDLRTPLQVIELGVGVLADPALSPQARASVAVRLERATTSMGRLVQDLLDHESQEGGALSLVIEMLDLEALVGDAMELMGPLAAQAQIALALHTEGRVCVSGDQGRLHQVLTNLIGNALKFTPAGGTITVRVEREAGRAMVCVTDTGVGIAAVDLDTIFNPYVRVRSVDARGAGLGLAIARRILEAHGGEIGVRSRPGEGSTFWFSLPCDNDA